MSSEEERARATGSTYRKSRKNFTCDFRGIRADRETDMQKRDHNTSHPYWRRNNHLIFDNVKYLTLVGVLVRILDL